MASHKRYIRRLIANGLALMGLLILASLLLGDETQSELAATGSEQEQAGSRERLHKLLAERYRLRRDIVESLEPFVNAGRVDIAQLRDATIAMHRAEADLCTTVAERLKVYEKMVDVLRRHEEHAVNRAEAGRTSEAELIEARVATVEAQIELEKLRLAGERSP